MSENIQALFHDAQQASKAIQSLMEADVDPKNLSVVMSEATHNDQILPENSAKGNNTLAEGVGAGAIFGMAVGEFSVAGTGEPESGSSGIMAAGPMVAALAIEETTNLTGHFVSSMASYGIPEEQAKYYHQHIEDGGVLVVIHVYSNSETEKLLDLLKQHKPLQLTHQ